MAVPKHIGAYSVECYNVSGGPNNYPRCPIYRSSFNSVVDDIDLHELYYPGWRAAIQDSKAQGVMCAYNAINGVPSCANADMLRTSLVDEWGLDGFVISDADAVAQIGPGSPQDGGFEPGHSFVPSLYEAAISALRNGTTISLENSGSAASSAYVRVFSFSVMHYNSFQFVYNPFNYFKSESKCSIDRFRRYAHELLPALSAGRVTLSEIKAAVKRALTPRFRVGLYDPPQVVPWNAIPASVIESEAHHKLARRAASESVVLLKNANGVRELGKELFFLKRATPSSLDLSLTTSLTVTNRVL